MRRLTVYARMGRHHHRPTPRKLLTQLAVGTVIAFALIAVILQMVSGDQGCT